jgi:2-oxoglutarate ferredoxin oxidoreductase subunit alpha
MGREGGSEVKLPAGTYFGQGNEACVEAAIVSGIKFYAGYPITPSTEIAEGLAERLPEEKGVFMQMEDEIASISACIGASWTGAKTMTATSGPGFSLMQESIGYAAVTETPVVIVDSMRGGPSTGMPTAPAQGDVMQARYGSHGDYAPIVLAASSVQDMFDLTVKAFNVSEKYRVPTILLTDAEISHMRGKFVVARDLEVFDRLMRDDKVWHDGFAYDQGLVPRFPVFGKGNRVHVTGLSHDIAGYPRDDFEVHEEMVRRLTEKVEKHRREFDYVDSFHPSAGTLLISYGSPALAAREVAQADEDVGLLNLKTLWPFPEEDVRRAAEGARQVIVIEMNLGQVFREVQRALCSLGCGKVRLLSKVGGDVISPNEIRREIGRAD